MMMYNGKVTKGDTKLVRNFSSDENRDETSDQKMAQMRVHVCKDGIFLPRWENNSDKIV